MSDGQPKAVQPPQPTRPKTVSQNGSQQVRRAIPQPAVRPVQNVVVECGCKPSKLQKVLRTIWLVLLGIALPFRMAAWALEAAIAAAMVAVMGTALAWWANWITDEEVAQFLGKLGARGLNILTQSGIL